MNTKSKIAISIGIAAIMMVSLFAVMSVSSSQSVVVTDCSIGTSDDKVYFTIYSDARAKGYVKLSVNRAYEDRKRFSLNAGETKTLSFRDYRWNGVDDVKVRVDSSCCNPIEPTPPTPRPSSGPDLVITDIWNNDGTICFKMENQGTEEAGSSYTALYINSAYQARKKVGSLDSGESKERCFRYVYTPGTDDIVKVCADSENDVAESNEGNNCKELIPGGKPDLEVIEMWEEFVDGEVIVHFVIHNDGDAEAGASHATLYIDDMVVETQNVLVPELGPSGRFTGTFAAEVCTCGTTITVRVCADDTPVVDESSENNNCMTNMYTYTCPVPEKPDLEGIEMWVEFVDGVVIVHFVIPNDGDAEAGASYATLYLDDMVVETQNVLVPELGPSGRFTDTFAAEVCTRGTTITVRGHCRIFQ